MGMRCTEADILDTKRIVNKIHQVIEGLDDPEQDADRDDADLSKLTNTLGESWSRLKENLTLYSSENDSGINILQNKLESLDSTVTFINQQNWKGKMGSDYCKRIEFLQISKNRNAIYEKKMKRDALEGVLQSMKSSVAVRISEKETKQVACHNLKKSLSDAKEELLKPIKEEPTNPPKWHFEGFYLGMLDITKRELDENTVSFEFQNSTNAAKTSARLILITTFAKSPNNDQNCKLIDAEINIPSIDAADVINYAIKNNDCTYLLIQLKRLWKKHFPILQEIDIIRNRKYPIDWNVEENTLCILLGNRNTVNLKLKIPSDYPGQGLVTVESISGGPEHIKLEDLKPTSAGTPSLLTWVEYLVEIFNKPHEIIP